MKKQSDPARVLVFRPRRALSIVPSREGEGAPSKWLQSLVRDLEILDRVQPNTVRVYAEAAALEVAEVQGGVG